MLIARLIASTIRTGRCTSLASSVLLLNSLLMASPTPGMVVLDFVEGSGKCVEKPSIKVSKKHNSKDQGENLRADDSQDECTPRQVARVITSVRCLPGHSV